MDSIGDLINLSHLYFNEDTFISIYTLAEKNIVVIYAQTHV